MYKKTILCYKVGRYEEHSAYRSFFEKEFNLSRFLTDRCDNLHKAGIAMVKDYNIPLFKVNEKMKEDLMMANLFDVSDDRWHQMLAQLSEMERPGLQLFLANRDFPAHVTIQVSVGGMKAQTDLIQNVTRVSFIIFNRLVLDPAGNILLMSEGIPSLISKWREVASQIMTSHGGQPKLIQILHSSVARFTQADSVTDEERKYLVKFVDYWNSEFERSPFGTHTKSVFVGTVYDLLKSK
jgi:hypothetical protein